MQVKTHIGDILSCYMEDNPGFETPAEIAAKSGIDIEVIKGLLDGRIRMTPEFSKKLVAIFDNLDDENFWMRMQEGCDG